MMEIFTESAIQKEKFRSAANHLLNKCFLLKKNEDTRNDYVFVLQHRQKFVEYFDLLGYSLLINENSGVISLTNEFGTGRLRLKKGESIILLIFRLLYIEKRKTLSLNQETVVLMEEVHDKYNLLKVKSKPSIDKSALRESIRIFKRYNLLKPLDSDVTLGECRIKLYPSIMFALSNADIGTYYESITEKAVKYINGGANDDDEETQADQID